MGHQVHWWLLFIVLLCIHEVDAVRVLLHACLNGGVEDDVQQVIVQDLDLEHLPHPKSSVCSLEIFNSNTSSIQDGLFVDFTGSLTLSLYNNNIHNISANAFLGLTALRTLNLSMNPIKEWQTSKLISHVPNLTTLDLTGTSPWLPDYGILRVKQLRTVQGVSWGQHCWNCSLIKSNTSSQLKLYTEGSTRYIKGYACRTITTTASKIVQGFANQGFLGQCVIENPKCSQSEMKEFLKAPCRDTTLSVMYLQFVLGPLAIALNLIVIITTICSKRLHNNLDMVLVCNIGVGDLFNGVYSVLIISIHTFKTFDQMLTFAHNYCASIGFFWVLGICLAVGFAFVLTIERYKCVVRTQPRHSRMSPTTLLVASAICWLWALAATILPVFGVGSYSLNTYCISVFAVKSNPLQFYYSTTVAGLSGLLYLATIPIYIKMYLFVRRSSKNMRIRADIELAKRVFSLVSTNMLFFLLPVIISLIFASVNRETSAISREVSEVLNSAFPLLCLTLNSVFNPLLYAFRSKLFRTEFVRMLSSRCSFNGSGHKTRPTSLKRYPARVAYVVRSPNNSTSLVTL
ncbi:sphingosine 1-phosphate receptor 2-like isoform X2 [Actinia tenebrosa]|nr:sphingosine 1-phosphate receptor 2-like isoform X2 [Actinia tenebrosa]